MRESETNNIKEENMSYMGDGYSGYEFQECPLCGQGMWNGRCEDPDCEYHWHPLDEEDDNEQ